MGARTGNPTWVDSATVAEAEANPGRRITAAKLNAIETAIDNSAEAVHDHDATDITTGTLSPARLGTGTRDGSRFLRDDGAWAEPPSGGGGSTTVQIGTVTLPASPTQGQSVSVLADSTTVLPEDVTWDSGGEPTVADRLLVSFVWSGTDWVGTYGPPIPAASVPPDETGPTAGTLGVVVTSTTADGTVTGAADETELHVTPYSFRIDAGTWSAWQAGATYEWTGLTASTEYDFQHRVRDAAGNITEGTVVTDSTDAPSGDTTDPTPGTLAASAITSESFTLTVTGASDETALHAQPYRFSTDNGATYSTWQTSAVFNATELDAETEYDCVHQVRDAALNVATGTSIPVETNAGVAPIATDTFTAADGALTGHVTDTGSLTWLAPDGAISPFADTSALISTNRLTGPSDNSGGYNRLDLGVPDFAVSYDYTLVASPGQPIIGCRRADATASSGVMFRTKYTGSPTNAWTLVKVVNGTETMLTPAEFAVPLTGTATMTVLGDQITFAIGEASHTVTYASNPTQDVLIFGVYGDATKCHVDNLTVTAL